MRIKHFFLLTLLMLVLSELVPIKAQAPIAKSTLIENYGGKQFYLHTVEVKQTVYGIAKAYDVTVNEIETYNPETKGVIRVGHVLKIPVKGNSQVVQNQQPTQHRNTKIPSREEELNRVLNFEEEYDVIYHVSTRNETFKHIADIYIVSESSVREANPDLSEPLKEGQYVIVPIAPKSKLGPITDRPDFQRSSYDPYSSTSQQRNQPLTPLEREELIETPRVRPHPNEVYEEKEIETIMPFSFSESSENQQNQETASTFNTSEIPSSHLVKPGETAATIAKDYGIDEEMLIAFNPGISSGVRSGMVLRLPTQNNEFEYGQETGYEIIHVVKKGETLYSILRQYGVTINELKQHNPHLTETLSTGQELNIPKKKITKPYIEYRVDSRQTVKKFVKQWGISKSEFEAENPSIGRQIEPGQVVRIPLDKKLVTIEPITPTKPTDSEITQQQKQDTIETPLVVETTCKSAKKKNTYKVALMLPFYLDEMNQSYFSKTNSKVALLNENPFSFIHYYEGFMMAVDSIIKTRGINIDLYVYDINQSVESTQKALNDPKLKDVDLIVGPFFGKSFDQIADFARRHQIMIVNPLSQRSTIVDNNPMVVKLKPNTNAQFEQLVALLNSRYANAKVFIVRPNSYTDDYEISQLEDAVYRSVSPTVNIPNDAILSYVDSKSKRNILPSISIEGRTFYTKDLQNDLYGYTTFDNTITSFVFSPAEIAKIAENVSELRENVVIVYGDDRVFATQFVNEMNKINGNFPITVIALPEWEKFDKLFIENLIKMKAIYFADSHIYYDDYLVEDFVRRFRDEYHCEPEKYAFEGFDAAWYFLNALAEFGSNPIECLYNYHIPLLQTNFFFEKRTINSGLENNYWNIYQYYDYQRIPLINTIFFYDK
ncbi:MAG: LysM peptidoglycan-binding domain-containing protein [Lentimicrobiaceae bacterium]|jgi:LysM repeat protein|nr:LysM peptidoglycan-binding domain-containing protein [Lentimicrobiaceae bacterium]